MKKITILVDRLEELLPDSRLGREHRNLARFITRAEHSGQQYESKHSLLMRLFGLDQNQGPAPFNMLGDGLQPGGDYCIHADPVSLYVDLARVFITGWGANALPESSLPELTSGLAEHFRAEGMMLEAPSVKRWYLRLEDPGIAGLQPPGQALGCDIGELLDGAPNFWKTLLNECQMILHRNPVNEELSNQGQLPANSLWFWGGGRLPERRAAGLGAVLGDSNLLTGLATWAGVRQLEDINEMLQFDEDSDGLVIVSNQAANKALDSLDQLMNRLLVSIKNAELDTLCLLGNRVALQLKLRDWRSVWRRRKLTVND
jgi:hypothetical protein